ncbi:MAG: RDD family protein [Microthrixaceae bacterium]
MGARVITPEAVILELPTAGVATRAFARMLDLAIFAFVLATLGRLLWIPLILGGSGVLFTMLMLFLFLLVMPIGTEILWKGQSFGKSMFGLRVVGLDGSPMAPRQALVRGLVGLVDIFVSLGFVALFTAQFSISSQRSGDMAAGTVVIRTRGAAKRLTPIAFHPPVGYEYYISTLDVGRLDDADFTLIREFLLRVRELSPATRHQIADQLARRTLERIQHVLPASIDPELWLICVASAYQARQGGLLADAALGLAPLADRWANVR